MGSVVIVVMQPAVIGRCAGFFGEVGLGVGPFLVEGAVESLDFAVGLRAVGAGLLVDDVGTDGLGEQL